MKDEVIAQAELHPGADPNALLRLVTSYDGSGPLALVGHEPSLSLFARHLLGGEAVVPSLKKSGICCITYKPATAEDKLAEVNFRFLLDPKEMTLAYELESVSNAEQAAS